MQKRKIVLIMMFAICSILWSFNIATAEIFMSVSGKVSDEITGQGIQGATVFLEDAIQQGNKSQITISSTGNFKFEFIRAGKYSLYVLAPAGYVNVITPIPVEVISGKNIIDLNVILKKGGSISGIIYQSDGITPLSNAVVSAMARDGSVGSGISNANGSYVINGIAPSNAYRVMVNIIGQAIVVKQSVQVISNQTTLLNIILKSFPTEIKGAVTDNGGTPIQGATVLLSPMTPQADSEISNAIGIAVTDNNGKFSVKGLIPGLYKAIVKAPNYDTVEQLNINILSASPVIINFTLNVKIGWLHQELNLASNKDELFWKRSNSFKLNFQLAACEPSGGPGSSPDRGDPESELERCLQKARLDYTKNIAHALEMEIMGLSVCLAAAWALGPPAYLACEVGIQMLALGEIMLAVAQLQVNLALCQQQYNNSVNQPPSPPGGADCDPPGGDHPDDWKGMLPSFIKIHPILRDNSLILAI